MVTKKKKNTTSTKMKWWTEWDEIAFTETMNSEKCISISGTRHLPLDHIPIMRLEMHFQMALFFLLIFVFCPALYTQNNNVEIMCNDIRICIFNIQCFFALLTVKCTLQMQTIIQCQFRRWIIDLLFFFFCISKKEKIRPNNTTN